MSMSYFIQMSDSEKFKLEGNWVDFRYGEGDNELYKVSTTPGDSFEIAFSGSGISVWAVIKLTEEQPCIYRWRTLQESSTVTIVLKLENGTATDNTSFTRWT